MWRFSISDLGLFLGKSPATIRSWERKGLIRLPRVGGKRSMGLNDVREVARVAYNNDRISYERRQRIAEVLVDLGALGEMKESDWL